MGNQMLLVLLAAVLFSTVILYTYDHVFTQRELVYNGMYMLQGQKIADSLFQRIESDLLQTVFENRPEFAYMTKFAYVFTNHTTYSTPVSKTIDGITYDIMLTSAACDSVGNTASPSADYQRIDIRINCCPNGSDTLYIGTASNPLTRVYTASGM